MNDSSSWTSRRARELVALIASRDISSRALLSAYFERVDALNPKINAVITEDRQRALDAAEAADAAVQRGEDLGPLHGLPMTVKDTFDVAGMRTTNGLPWLGNNVVDRDADLVALLRDAGAIIWGKTNLPFASYDWNSNHPTAGKCRNPWSPKHGPGGSSGGSAASLAAGFTALELGSDVAGSIRHPSHSCGVYGLRTTEGALSTRGHGRAPGSPSALRHHLAVGPMARHPEDLRLTLPILLQSTEGGKTIHLREAPAKPLSETRIAWTATWSGVPLCDDTRRVLDDTVGRLESGGAQVQEVDLPFDLDRVYEAYGVTHGFEFAALFPKLLRHRLGLHVARHLYFPLKYGRGKFSRFIGQGLTASPRQYFKMLDVRQACMEAFAAWFDDWDLWITPVAATTAFPLGTFNRPVRIQGRRIPYCQTVGPFCAPTAGLGHPILAVPSGYGANGLPIGLQFHARHWNDRRLVDWVCEASEVLPSPHFPDGSSPDDPSVRA